MTWRARSVGVPLNAVDHVVVLEPGRIRTRKAITANEPYFPGHYPNHPIYPGVFIVEAVCQAVRRYAAQFDESVTVRRIVSSRFRLPLQPGDVLEVDCDCVRDPQAAGITVKAVCSSGHGKVAEIKAVFDVEGKR
jgi:3-hydroxyacyl-[acyl-carrier-protein] dehydratase